MKNVECWWKWQTREVKAIPPRTSHPLTFSLCSSFLSFLRAPNRRGFCSLVLAAWIRRRWFLCPLRRLASPSSSLGPRPADLDLWPWPVAHALDPTICSFASRSLKTRLKKEDYYTELYTLTSLHLIMMPRGTNLKLKFMHYAYMERDSNFSVKPQLVQLVSDTSSP